MDPPRLFFLYDDAGDILASSIILTNDNVQPALLDDIVPMIAQKLSERLGKQIPQKFSFWELKEPGSSLSLLANTALSEIARSLPITTRIHPYIFRDTEPIKLFVDLIGTHKGEKRALEVSLDDVVEFVKRTKTTSPSNTALGGNFRSDREDGTGEWLIDHRRLPGTPLPTRIADLPPITLQYNGFGYFLDIFRGRKDVPGMENVSPSRIRSAVDDFADRMSLIYPDEFSRNKEGLKALNSIFSARTDNLSFLLSRGPIGNHAQTDGHILGPHEATYCIVEFKNEAIGNCIPYVEMMTAFQHSTKDLAQDFPWVMRAWNTPCLGMTIVGPCITFYAMIHFREWRIVTLTPGLSCIRHSGDGDDRNALYDAFTAASVLLAHIKEDATRLVEPRGDQIGGSRDLPAVSTLRDPSRSASVEFKILSKFSLRRLDRYLYIAQLNDGKQIIVKFTRRYSYELHEFCASHGYAPKLLGFERLPGGFFCVAMDFFHPADAITSYGRDPSLGKWAQQLEGLVGAFHAKGLVHGDLRDPNILCDGKKVMVIDFDWGGKEGEAFYPNDELNADLTDGRGGTDLSITKADDLRVLCRTLKSMGVECGHCRRKVLERGPVQ